MESKYKFVQVYNVWVHGRSLDDVDQQFPIDANVDSHGNWHNDFSKAYEDYFKAEVKDECEEYILNSTIFEDYIVTLYVIDVDVEKFEKEYGMKFDLENDDVQEAIPYYDDYKFTTVAERISKFN
jgi:hypothetical protein|tara:strand:- start:271 stop:645 length:375 start_codon:yes stop_codon:yes gene_type:complete